MLLNLKTILQWLVTIMTTNVVCMISICLQAKVPNILKISLKRKRGAAKMNVSRMMNPILKLLMSVWII